MCNTQICSIIKLISQTATRFTLPRQRKTCWPFHQRIHINQPAPSFEWCCKTARIRGHLLSEALYQKSSSCLIITFGIAIFIARFACLSVVTAISKVNSEEKTPRREWVLCENRSEIFSSPTGSTRSPTFVMHSNRRQGVSMFPTASKICLETLETPGR